jgi:glutamate-5-semialdehyde dehydrogenase
MEISQKAKIAKQASISLAAVKTELKNKALAAIAEAIRKQKEQIIAANKTDLAAAEENKLSSPLLKRLKFDEKKINEACAGIESLIKLDDPVGKILSATELDDGLELFKVSCPIGVIGVIFESRPDALVQISTLCLKSGNAVLLKGGSEAVKTNKILAGIIEQAAKEFLPEGWIQLLETREDVAEMLKLDEYIDLIVPRGSNQFVKFIMDSKCQYVAVCNAAETLLVDEKIAKEFLPKVKAALEKQQVEIRGCEKTRKIIDVKEATDEDWRTEYLDLIISVKIVDGLDEAIEHINKYGSKHTDAIVTSDKAKAEKFMELVDSANVLWNCSTRFSDGYRYGLGAEVGISTNKLHARGPVGLEGLMIYKWKLLGKGQTVEDYATGKKNFRHKKIR